MKTTDTQPKKAAEPETSRAATQPDQRPAATAQRKQQADINASPRQQNQALPAQLAAPNRTGLPNQLKAGVESLSGYSLDDVRVHYNSAKPAQLQAYAYAQGTDIHVAPGQEQHLPHEAWHVVQQKQGRVAATRQMKGGVAVNDDAGLEKEADVMGERALQFLEDKTVQMQMDVKVPRVQNSIVQRKLAETRVREIAEELNYTPDTVPLTSAARQVWRLLGEKVGTDEHVTQVLRKMGYEDLVTLSETLGMIRRQIGQQEEAQQIITDEMRAAGITSLDKGKVIGPFNGGRGSRQEVGPSQGAVYYDASGDYCISVDNAGHAGAGTWKLFSKSGGSWQRVDTLFPDGRRMNRG